MKYYLTACLAVLMSITNYAQPIMIDEVVAVVGNRAILFSEIEERYQLMVAQQGFAPEGAHCSILDQIMVQELLLVHAERDSVSVGEEEVESQLNARIDAILQQMGNQEDQFELYYGKSVIEVKEDFRGDLRNMLTAERMQSTVMSDVTITPAEVKYFFSQIPKDSLPFFNAEVEVGEIVVKPKVNKVELQKAYDKLLKLRTDIVTNGESFEDMASRYSDDPGSAARGGELGWIRRGDMVPEFEAAAFKLGNGEISDVIKSEYGYHIIQLMERRGNTANVRHILVQPNITDGDKDKAVAKLDSIKNLIEMDSINFITAVKLYSEDEQTKSNAGRLINPQTGNSAYEIGDLPTDVYFAIDTLDEDELSSPIEYQDARGNLQYRIVVPLNQTEPHRANLRQDYSKIQGAALEDKKMREMSFWVTDKVGRTYIKVDDSYKSCETLDKWFMEPNDLKN